MKTIETTLIPLSRLERNKGQIEGLPANPRTMTRTKFKQLRDSIENGEKMLNLRELLVFAVGDGTACKQHYVVIGGNMRLEALKSLKKKTAPCKIIPPDTTIDELKKITLLDNGSYGDWSCDQLANEWDSLDLDSFGVKFCMAASDLNTGDTSSAQQKQETKGEDEKPKVNERERTYNSYNLHFYDESRSVGNYNIPLLSAEYIKKPDRLIGFNYALSTDSGKNSGVHCFLDDYQIERLWTEPDRYAEPLKKFSCVLTPDYSLYNEMPLSMIIWNTYRSRLVGQILQDSGLHVIPSISWSDARSYDFCFDGVPQNSIVAVSTIGVKKDTGNKSLFYDGFRQMIQRVKPREIWCYGGEMDLECECPVYFFKNEVTDKFKKNYENTEI